MAKRSCSSAVRSSGTRRAGSKLALCVLAAIGGAACGNHGPAPTRRSAAIIAAERSPAAKPSERRGWHPLAPSATSAWRSLSFFLPNNVEGFRPRAVLDGRDLDVGGEEPVLMARRAYSNNDGVSLELEVLDAARCPRLRELVLRTRELARENKEAVLRALKVQGQRGEAQWFASNKTARTSVVVADRFIVHAVVKPVDSPALSIAVAEQLDFAGLEKLPPTAAEPALAKVADKSTSVAAALDDAPADGAQKPDPGDDTPADQP
jgi:hypothetical protein